MVADVDLVAHATPLPVSRMIAGGGAGLGGGVLRDLLGHAGGFVGVGFVGAAGHFDGLGKYG